MTQRIPLLLVPGLLCDAALWRHQAEHLGDIADISVGETTRDETMPAMARRVLERAPSAFALAGLSMGGYVCLEIMRQAPERVRRLALLDTAAIADDAARRKQRQDLTTLAETGKFKGVTPRLLPLLIHPERLDDAALTGEVMAMAGRVGKAAFLMQQRAILSRTDSRPGLGAIDVPTLVLCGRQDALTPVARHVEMASAIPGARLGVIEDCGHLSTMERPEAATALMRDWLLRT
ncbi:MAG: alpha/beta hydrolase [Alphaproteobacteria bacterium]|nr:alpha/beta hydrolase [Alphaproteobacteria bacterium]